jgi:hypothetical protein
MTKLKLVNEEKQEEFERNALFLARQQADESFKLTRAEIANRVHQLRTELEAAKQRYDGALFDNFTDGIPPSLDHVGVNREPCTAVDFLSPKLECMRETLQHSNDPINQSDDVFDLYFWSTQTAYEFGMLAGAIYADSPAAIIDRFERGLVTALASCHWIIKEEERP